MEGGKMGGYDEGELRDRNREQETGNVGQGNLRGVVQNSRILSDI